MINTRHQIDLVAVQRMLDCISPNMEREQWARILMAIKSEFGENGRNIAQAWSQLGANYDAKAFNSTWKSIKVGGKVTIATLVREAKNNGFKFDQTLKAAIIHESKAIRAKRAKESAKSIRQQKILQEKVYQKAKEKAQFIYDKSDLFSIGCVPPYLHNKGLETYAIGFAWLRRQSNTLIVPVCHLTHPTPPKPTEYQALARSNSYQLDPADLTIKSLQFIQPNGDKLFLRDGKISGGFCPVRFTGKVNSIVIAEGIATALTYAAVYDQDSVVVCAFNAVNLLPVARAFRRYYPYAEITIAADNDKKTELKTGKNPGIFYANKAAQAVAGEVVYPEFKEYEIGTDFNDRYLLDLMSYEVTYA